MFVSVSVHAHMPRTTNEGHESVLGVSRTRLLVRRGVLQRLQEARERRAPLVRRRRGGRGASVGGGARLTPWRHISSSSGSRHVRQQARRQLLKPRRVQRLVLLAVLRVRARGAARQQRRHGRRRVRKQLAQERRVARVAHQRLVLAPRRRRRVLARNAALPGQHRAVLRHVRLDDVAQRSHRGSRRRRGTRRRRGRLRGGRRVDTERGPQVRSRTCARSVSGACRRRWACVRAWRAKTRM